MPTRVLRRWLSSIGRPLPRPRSLRVNRFERRDLDALAQSRRTARGAVEAVLRAGLRTDRGDRPTRRDCRRFERNERQVLLADAIAANARIHGIDIFRATRRIDIRPLLLQPVHESELECLAAVFVDAYLEADTLAAGPRPTSMSTA
jgi:hypothetical protein